RYFGVDLELTQMANQDLLLHGVEVSYPAAAILLVAVLACLAAHTLLTRLLAARPRAAGRVAVGLGVCGALLAGRALYGIVVSGVAQRETPGTTPLSLTLCAPLLVYALWLARRTGEGGWRESAETDALERRGRVVAIALGVIGLFW